MNFKRFGLIVLLGLFIIVTFLTLPRLTERETKNYSSQNTYQKLKETIDVLEGYYLTNEILFDLNDDEVIETYETLLNATTLGEMRNGLIRMQFDEGITFEDILEVHRFDDELLQRIFPHRTYRLMESSISDTGAPHIDVLNMVKAWDYSTGEGVSIAVIDTGIDYTIEAFKGIVSERSYNAITKQVGLEHVMDFEGHGTAVSGIIKHRYNGLDHQGIAPDVELVVIKTGDYPQIRQSEIDEAIHYAIEQNIDIINMSLSGPGYQLYDKYTEQSNALLNKAIEEGIIIVASASNDAEYSHVWPASHPKVISVGATTLEGSELANYSNRGRFIDVVAPGQIETFSLGSGTYFPSGTSISAPAIAGIVALYLSLNPEASFEEVYGMLISTATDLDSQGRDIHYGYGQVNAETFLTAEKGIITFIDSLHGETLQKYSAIGYPIVDVWRPHTNNLRYGGWSYDESGENSLIIYEDNLTNDTTLYKQWLDNSADTHEDLFLFKAEEETVILQSYLGLERTINIPNKYRNQPIKSIKSYAFTSLFDTHRITLSETIETIHEYSFIDSSINQIEFSQNGNLKTINSYAFLNIVNLSKIILPDSVERLEENAFTSIYNLSYFYIGENLEYLGRNSITALLASEYHYGEFDEIEVHPDNQYFTSIDGVLYNKDLTTLIKYPTQRRDKSFVIPDTVTKLAEGSIYFTEYLEELTFGASLKEIPKYFSLHNLQAIHVHPENPYYESIQGVLYDSSMTILLYYPVRASNYEIVIPSTVTYFYRYAFDAFFVFTNYGEIHTLLYLGENFLDREVDEESIHELGLDSNHIVGIEELSKNFYDRNVPLKNVYMSEVMHDSVTTMFEDLWFTRNGFELHAYDALELKTETLNDAYHFNYEVSVDYDILYNDKTIGQVLLREMVDLNQAFNNTFETTITIKYLNHDLIINLPLYPSIQFETVGGGYIEPIRFDDNFTMITNLPVPEKEGYTFTSWYLDSAYEVPFNAETISSKTTLYAKYEPLTYTARFHYNDQTTTKLYTYDTLIDYLIEDDDQILIDWVTEEDLSYILHTMPNHDLDLYPIYETNDNKTAFQDYRFVIESGYAMITDYYGSDQSVHLPTYFKNDQGEVYYVKGLKTGVFSKNKTIVEVVFPNHYKDIGTYAFYQSSSLESVTLPSQLQSIRPYAFSDIETLESVFIPNYVKYIGRSAFADSENIKTIEFEIDSRLERIEHRAFSGVRKTQVLDIPDSVNYLGDGTFVHMTALKTLNLPAYLKVIPPNMLNHTSVQALVLPETIEVINKEAFRNNLFEGTIIIPPRVNILADKVFYDNPNIDSFFLGESVTTLHSNAFASMEGLTTIEVDENNNRYKMVNDMLLTFDQSTLIVYPNANPRRHVIIPEGVKYIGPYVFYANNYLETVTMSDDVERLGEAVFKNANRLHKVVLSEQIKIIPHEAFSGTTNLKHISLPKGLKDIGRYAFLSSGLQEVVIPDNTAFIQGNAFAETTSLDMIIFPHDITLDQGVLRFSSVRNIIFKGDILDYYRYYSVSGGEPFGENPNLESIFIHEDYEDSLIEYMQYFHSYNLDKIQVFDQLYLNEDNQNIMIDDRLNNKNIDLVLNNNTLHQIPFMYLIDTDYYANPLLLEKGLNTLKVRNGETMSSITISLEESLHRIRYFDSSNILKSEAYYLKGSEIVLPEIKSYDYDGIYIYRFEGFSEHDTIVSNHQDITLLFDTFKIEEVVELIGPRKVPLHTQRPNYHLIISPELNLRYNQYVNIYPDRLGVQEAVFTVYEKGSFENLFDIVYQIEVVEPYLTLELNGKSRVIVELGSNWMDPGADCAYIDGTACQVEISGTVNLDEVGYYAKTYSYTDNEGNYYEEVRYINVLDQTPPEVKLNPSIDTVHQGMSWEDAGVDVFDYSRYTVEKIGTVDTTQVGQYEIIYVVTDVYHNQTTVKRIINVVKGLTVIEFNLADAVTTILVGEPFIDTGCDVTINGDTLQCTIKENNIDTGQPGIYYIIYSINYKGVEYLEYRYVFVIEENIELFLTTFHKRKEDELW